jgi:hypothetical protein
MKRSIAALFALCLLAGCGEEHGGVSGSQPKQVLDNVQQQLDQAADDAEERIEDAMQKVEGEL